MFQQPARSNSVESVAKHRSLRWVPAVSFIVVAGLAGGCGERPASAATLQCRNLPILFKSYMQNHYSMRSETEEIRSRTASEFIKALDPSKTMLLQSDVEKLRPSLEKVFGSMKEGNCKTLEEAHALILKRAQDDERTVKALVTKDFKLDESVEIVLDPDRRGYAKTEAERKDLLRKLVHLQYSNYLLADVKPEDARKQLTHRYELVSRRLQERQQRGEMPVLFAESFATALDPHSSYLSPESLEDFQIQMRLSLEGIGASLSSQDGFTVIEDLIPGGSAEKSKLLRPKDKIMAVAQDGGKPVATMDMDLRDVVKMIRGKKGTKVNLTVLRQGETTETFDVTLVRDKIAIQDQAAKITYETRKVGERSYKIGILDLPSFYGGGSGDDARSSYLDVKALVEDAKRQKADGLVLDLSRNGGGLLEEAVRISGLFIRRGPIVATRDSAMRQDILADTDASTQWSGPLVVMTSHLSASASEILAGALKDYRRALIVGSDHTFGKGTVQVLQSLPANLGAMKVTTGMFFVPGGASTQHVGVTADVKVPSIFNNEEVGERSMDYSLPPQSTQVFLGPEANSIETGEHWRLVDDATVKLLAKRSEQRVREGGAFTEIQKELAEAEKNRGVVKLADLRKKERKVDSKASAKEREKQLNDLEKPFLDEGISVMVDYITLASSK